MFTQILINSLISASIYALLAMSFFLIYSNTKFFNMTHGVVAAVGGYGTFYFAKMLGWNIYLSIILGIFIAGLLGYLLNLIIFEKIKKRNSSNTVLLVASLGALAVIQSFIAIFFTNQFQTLSDNNSLEKIYTLGSAVFTQTQIIIFCAAWLIFGSLIFIFKYTKFGKILRAVSDDAEVAEVIGINTTSIIRKIFFIGPAIAGLAGVLVGFDTGLEPTMGLHLLLKGVIAAIIGGIGNIYGAFLGAILLGLIENFGIWKISGEWQDAIAFTILILFLLIRPQGIIKR